jgi:molecular chaperone HscB
VRLRRVVSCVKLLAVNLQSNDFELFNLPLTFAQDRAATDARWKDLQREAHPDKFAAQGAAAQRIAMQWSVRINEAYQRLKDPVKRAAYLCELHHAPINAENNTAMPAAFLVQQMELREALDDATSQADVDPIHAQAQQIMRSQLADIARLIDTDHNYSAAAQSVRALMFIERFTQDIEARMDALTH